MSRIVSANLGTAVWRAGLADPYLHWRREKSAWEMAVSWESQRTTATGLPPEVYRVLAGHDAFLSPTLLLGIVEHRVALDTTRTPSQNDLSCMLLTKSGQVSVAVEAKAGEDFDKTLGEWLGKEKESGGKRRRLDFLCKLLDIEQPPSPLLRYQLFHRAASAVLEARRWHVGKALMLVQSFKESATSWDDYVAFATQLAITPVRNAVSGPLRLPETDLYLAWIDSPMATDLVATTAI